MYPRRVAPMLLCLLVLGSAAWSEETPLPPGEKAPLLQFDVDGPTAAVNALALRKDKEGETLFAAGLDKVVRVWKIQDGKVTRQGSYRVPIGPGNAGVLNALAVSDDGRWLAMAGRGLMRGESRFQENSFVVPRDSLLPEMLHDLGNIYLVDLTQPPGTGGKVLRGHTGAIKTLAFAPAEAGQKNVLVSTAVERGQGKPAGAVFVWDVEQAALVAKLEKQLPATPAKPGLAIRRLGRGPRDLRIAIAWPEDGKVGGLRLWDVGAADKENVQRWSEGELNSTVAGIGKDRLLTGFLANRIPRLHLHRISGAAGEARSSFAEVEVPHPQDLFYLPVDMATLSDTLVAVLLRPSQRNESYVVALYEVTGKTPDLKASLTLRSTVADEVPVLAAVPGGRYLAVANYDNQYAIRLFSVRDILQARGEPENSLRIASAALATQQVAFVTRAGKPGLWLGDAASARLLDGGRLFDLEARKLGKDLAGWKLDQSDARAAGWMVTAEGAKPKRYQVRRGNQSFPPITLAKNQFGTASALLPEGGMVKQPILAVAHLDEESNEALITLFDVATGKPFVRLNGHLQRIHHLAFCGSLPLLASVAGDQTVCIWNLRDLDSASGTIEGLGLADDKNRVVVRSVEPGSPAARAGLKEGDILQGLTIAGPMQPVKSALGFYQDLDTCKPGTQVTLRVGDKTLTLPVSRGIEERKPLFSLFLPRSGGWVGWSPLGFYDASGPEAEKLLGWHTNTGQAVAPVTFARLEMYRKDFYREGVLADLAAGKPLVQARVQPPDPIARIRGADVDPDTPHLFIVRQRQAMLELEVDPDYVIHEKDTRSWQVVGPGGRQVLKDQPLKLVGTRRWEADLKGLDWKPGDYRLSVFYHSAQAEMTVTRDLTLRYLPPPPVLTVRVGGRVLTKDQPRAERSFVVREEKLPIEVEAQSADAEQTIAVQLLHGTPGQPLTIVKAENGRGKVELRQTQTLAEGIHTLRVYAGPAQLAVRGAEDSATQFDIEVIFKPRPEKVDITGLRIVPTGERRTAKTPAGVPIEVQLVDQPDVTLHAQVEGNAPLTQLDLLNGTEQPVSLLTAKETKSLVIERKVHLPMNQPHRLALRAKTGRSVPDEKDLWVVYSPVLPFPELPPFPQRTNQAEVDLKGKLSVTAPGLKYALTLQVTDEGGKESEIPVTVSPGANGREDTWEKRLRLSRGESRLRLVLKNDWRSTESEPFRIRYVHPPQILAADKVKVGKSPNVEIKATVRTPTELPPTRVLVNGRERTAGGFTWTPQTKAGDLTTGLLTIKDVAVKVTEGKEKGQWLKQVELIVSNQDGESEKPALVVIEPPEKEISTAPARITFPSIQRAGMQTHQKEFAVDFAISSESPIQAVELHRKLIGPKEKPYFQLIARADLTKVTGSAPNFRLQGSIPATLNPGDNRLSLLVRNEGAGEQWLDVPPLIYVVRAPRVLIEKIEPLKAPGQVLPLVRQDGQLRLPASPNSLLMLHGAVQWDDPQDKALTDPALEIQVFVNNMRGFPVALAPAETNSSRPRRTFQAPIALTEKNNVVELKLISLASQVEGDTLVHLDCTNPMKDQRLHVLIVGVDVDDAEKLKQSFFKAIGVTKAPEGLQGPFKKEPFKQAYLYQVVARQDALQETILGQLYKIKDEIQEQQRTTQWVNDVIFLYYQGSMVYKGNTCYLETKLNRRRPYAPVEEYAIDCRKLPTLPGMELVLLNLSEKGTPTLVTRPPVNDPLTGVVSYVSLGQEPRSTPQPHFLTLMAKALMASKVGSISEVVDNMVPLLKPDMEKLQKFNAPLLNTVVIGPPTPPQ